MQLSPKIKNKSLTWSLLLKVRVGTVVNAGGNYYYNTSGINSPVADTNNWFQISSIESAPTEKNKTVADFTGSDPNFGVSLALDSVPEFPTIFKVYLDILGDNNYMPMDPVIYNPSSKLLSGLSSPIDFPNQRLKIFFK